MAEIVLLLAVQKIGAALANRAADQASAQFAKYASQLSELHGSMGRIMRELRVMHDVLCQMDIQKRNNQVYEGWFDGVRKVAHVMEDMVDEYLHLVGWEHDIGCCFYLKKGFKKPRTLLSLNWIASRVKEVERDLTHLSEIKDRWVPMLDHGDTSRSTYIVKRSQDLANISRALDEEDLVGVDQNREKLTQWLADDDLERSVIVLHGMGGLGKTALAANVYRKEREKFQCDAWVCSQKFSSEDVLRNIIKELYKDKVSVPSNIDTMNIIGLEDTLKSFLEQRKYLIVLDDVWTPEAFVDLSRPLIQNNKGSRLVITTREGDVAAHASVGHILTLEALTEDKAWDLFCKKAFSRDRNHECPAELKTLYGEIVSKCKGLPSAIVSLFCKKAFSRDTNHECPAELKTLAGEIVSKCKGLPLAIVSVGSLLFLREKIVEEWRRIKDQLRWELINNSRLGHLRNVLHMSFIHLPAYLKSCFLYCSLFPEDYLFQRKMLVRLWIAEGFIEHRGERTLEEVAEDYLNELVRRNMLQVVERNSFGKIRRFKMHDILRELAADLCEKDCFGIAYEEDKCWGSLQKDGRRLVVHKLKKDIQQSFLRIHCFRSIITLDNTMPSFTLLPLVAEKSRYMSVLELKGLPIEKIPDAIGDLFNLRYLGLRHSKVKLLPKTVEKLTNLLTLDLYRSGVLELPGWIVKLKNLRHLLAEKDNDPSGRECRHGTGVRIPSGLGNLTDLRTLKALEAQEESIMHLGKLRRLRTLRIWNVKGIYCKNLFKSLREMQFLSFLNVNASDENDENGVLQLDGLPPKLQRLCLSGRLAEGVLDESRLLQAADICLLYLRWSQLREDPLPSLSRLSNLMHLGFGSASYNGEQLVFLTGWFPKLKTLFLRDLPNLNRLEIHQGTMASLEKLTLTNLNSMMEVPPGIEFLVTLKHLGFHEITPDFLTLLCQCSRIRGMNWRHTLRD